MSYNISELFEVSTNTNSMNQFEFWMYLGLIFVLALTVPNLLRLILYLWNKTDELKKERKAENNKIYVIEEI